MSVNVAMQASNASTAAQKLVSEVLRAGRSSSHPDLQELGALLMKGFLTLSIAARSKGKSTACHAQYAERSLSCTSSTCCWVNFWSHICRPWSFGKHQPILIDLAPAPLQGGGGVCMHPVDRQLCAGNTPKLLPALNAWLRHRWFSQHLWRSLQAQAAELCTATHKVRSCQQFQLQTGISRSPQL